LIDAGPLLESASALLGVSIALLPLIRMARLRENQQERFCTGIVGVSGFFALSVFFTALSYTSNSAHYLDAGFYTFLCGVVFIFAILFAFWLLICGEVVNQESNGETNNG